MNKGVADDSACSASCATRPRSVLVLGYGNPGRQDDGLGPAVVEEINQWGWEGVHAEADYQLNIEDAAAMAAYDITLFVDASVDGSEPFALRPVSPAQDITFTSHSVSAESVLAICKEHFGASPQAWLLGIRGYAFDFEEGLSDKARKNYEKAVAFTRSWIQAWREKDMEHAGAPKKTILTIDDDPDIRAALRMVLEAEGFSVGEAATGEEGVKIAERIKPDAIIIDLMMENVDSGVVAARKLKAENFAGPIYLLSSAGDTVRYNLDARDLGLAGIFQKPIDPKILVATLRAKLKEA